MNSPSFTAARYLSGGFSAGIHIGRYQVDAAPVAEETFIPDFRFSTRW